MILQVFNKYLGIGGEEKSVNRIFEHIGDVEEIERCFFDSREWTGDNAPNKLAQLRKYFYNHDAAQRFQAALDKKKYNAAVFHNIYPVGSPALYDIAQKNDLPVMQFLHNYRPFSVGGSLWVNGRVAEEALELDFREQVKAGTWQNSRLKSLLCSIMLKRLHQSGWLDSVHAWIGISDFVRDVFIRAGIPKEKVFSLRHSWDAMPEPPKTEDKGYYLFPSRLIDEKGVNELLGAWDILSKRLKNCPKLVIAGKGDLEGIIEEKAEELESVEFVGFIDGAQKKQLFSECRAVMMPSKWWEPLGLVVYEAYDYAKPVIAGLNGGIAETVMPEVTGLGTKEVSAENIASMVEKMESMTAEERKTMGERGREWLLENTSPEKWKDDFLTIYNKVK